MQIDNRLIAAATVLSSPFLGSFLGAVAVRLPQGRTVVHGRSACDACGHALGARDLFPLASYAVLRGRCRYCGAAIDPVHPLMEAGALALALWAATATTGWILVAGCMFGWTLLALAAIDWRSGILPDVLTLPLLALGLAVAYAIDSRTVAAHAVGAMAGLAGFSALAAIYRALRGRDGLGFGDAKLLAAEGAWLGWLGLPTTILYAAVLGLIAVLIRGWAGKPVQAADRLPFGPALALAAWLVWLYGPLIPG